LAQENCVNYIKSKCVFYNMMLTGIGLSGFFLLSLITPITPLTPGTPAAVEIVFPLYGAIHKWVDCSEEEKIEQPKIRFLNITSEPTIWNPSQPQVVKKTIENISGESIPSISIDFQQMYHVSLFNWWITFVHLYDVDQCPQYKGSVPPLCPFAANTTVHLEHTHSNISRVAPYGSYRSRQVYHNHETKEKIGCVDIAMEYRKGPKSESESETEEIKEIVA